MQDFSRDTVFSLCVMAAFTEVEILICEDITLLTTELSHEKDIWKTE